MTDGPAHDAAVARSRTDGALTHRGSLGTAAIGIGWVSKGIVGTRRLDASRCGAQRRACSLNLGGHGCLTHKVGGGFATR